MSFVLDLATVLVIHGDLVVSVHRVDQAGVTDGKITEKERNQKSSRSRSTLDRCCSVK